MEALKYLLNEWMNEWMNKCEDKETKEYKNGR